MALRREYGKMCEEFVEKGVDAMIFVTDGDGRPWRDVKREEREKFPQKRLVLAVHGVTDRNIECWICTDADYVANRLGIPAAELRVEDPKGRFETAMGITRDDKREDEIAQLVREAPLRQWLRSPSFEDFYEQVRRLSQMLGCEIENVREVVP